MGVGMQLSLGVKHEYHYGQDKMAAFCMFHGKSGKLLMLQASKSHYAIV